MATPQGIPPPTPTWGNMMGGAVANVLIPHWPLVVFPGLTITVVVLAFNFFGDALRDACDPQPAPQQSGLHREGRAPQGRLSPQLPLTT